MTITLKKLTPKNDKLDKDTRILINRQTTETQPDILSKSIDLKCSDKNTKLKIIISNPNKKENPKKENSIKKENIIKREHIIKSIENNIEDPMDDFEKFAMDKFSNMIDLSL